MSNSQSLAVRGFQLSTILDKPHGELELILRILDLENNLDACRKELQACKVPEVVDYQGNIEIEEFADDQCRLKNPPDEKAWIETLSYKTSLDIRAILTELPKELGMYKLRAVYKIANTLMTVDITVWVVPAE